MKDSKENLREFIKRWEVTGKFLEDLKQKEFEKLKRAEIFLSLTDASEAAIVQYPPVPTSGLIEMQRIFKRMKKK